jgi:hypothetical protein
VQSTPSWCRAASDGIGPERYSIRLPLFLAGNAKIADLEPGSAIRFVIAGHQAEIEDRERFLLLRVREFLAEEEASAFFKKIVAGLLWLCAKHGVSIFCSNSLDEILTPENCTWPSDAFRLGQENWPATWGPYVDGRIHGHISCITACVIPEHKRILEEMVGWIDLTRRFTAQELSEFIENPGIVVDQLGNPWVLSTIEGLRAACAQFDRRIEFMMLVAVLDALASPPENTCDASERLPNPAKSAVVTNDADLVPRVIEAVNDLGKQQGFTSEFIEEIIKRIARTEKPGMRTKIQRLVRETYSSRGYTEQQLQTLSKEVSKFLGRRSALAHGMALQKPLSVDDVLALKLIVCHALEFRMAG